MKPKTLEEACTALTMALVDCLEVLGHARDEPQPTTRLYSYDDLAQMLDKSKSRCGSGYALGSSESR